MRLIRLWFTDVLGQLKSGRHLPGRAGERPSQDGDALRRHRRSTGSAASRRPTSWPGPTPRTFELMPWVQGGRAGRPGVLRHPVTVDGRRRSPATAARCCKPQPRARRRTSGFTMMCAAPEMEYFLPGLRRPLSTATRCRSTTAGVLRPHDGRRVERPSGASAPSTRSRRWASRWSTASTRTAPSQHEIDLRYTDALDDGRQRS